MKKNLVAVMALALIPIVSNAKPLYIRAVHAPIGIVYKNLVVALGHQGFKVPWGINIEKRMQMANRTLHMPNFNAQHLTDVRAMMVCNPFLFNAIANADPTMIALCPLHITLVSKGGVTYVQYPKEIALAAHTPVAKIARLIDTKIERAINAVPQ
ncbi:MAG: DUF302 domain-containing protein [Acidiferrobacter sp.]